MNTTKFVILNAGEGHRTKSYGPKCLFELANKDTILERQIKNIKRAFTEADIYYILGFESHKVLKKNKDKIDKSNHIITDYQNTNQTKAIYDSIIRFNIEDCFIVFGDIVFDEKHFPQKPTTTTLYTSQNHVKNKIGINSNNGEASYMMWGLKNTWSEICYLNKDMINFIRNEVKSNSFWNRAYLIEIINYAIDCGHSVDVEPFGSEIIDIDKLNDLEVANAKFNIGKIRN